jgi:hypothetical protein
VGSPGCDSFALEILTSWRGCAQCRCGWMMWCTRSGNRMMAETCGHG